MNLTLNNVEMQYGNKKVLNGIDMDLAPGIYGLLGANGAGKTTLFKVISGYATKYKGEIHYPAGRKRAKEVLLGILPQVFVGYPLMTVYEFLMYMGRIKSGFNRAGIEEDVLNNMEIFGLKELQNKKLKSLSGGQLRRVGLAQAFLLNPKIILLDEPTTGLDPIERIRLKNYLSNISKTQIIIISTHIVSDLEHLANKIFIIKSGYIIASGNESELINDCEGSVWEVPIHDRDTEYSIKNELVSMIHEDRGVTVARVINRKKISKEARLVKPTLNDAYLYYFNGDQL